MVKFNPDNHTYTTEDGRILISVTQLLRKHGITPDFSKVPKEILEAKASRGTMIHKEIEDYISKGEIGFTEEFRYFLEHIFPMFKFIIAETLVYTDQYAGTSDIIGVDYNNALWIIDTKTGQVHKEGVRWQDSLYKKALLEMLAKGLITIDFDSTLPIHIAVFDAKEEGSKLEELDEIPAEEVEKLLKCEAEDTPFTANALVSIDQHLIEEARELEAAITALESHKKTLDEKYKAIKQQLQEAMHNSGVKNFTTDKISITLKASYQKTTVDSKRLQEKFPEVYEACCKKSTVGESILITLKESV